ncbi:MAG: transcriptional initiation protein Tat, partial [Acidobacteriota bacterium]|nr:transcriptional initiation protein Tat [Acidobacteriota bacterium]
MTESNPTGRRAFLWSSGFALAGLGLSPAFLRAATEQTPAKASGKVLVLVFQRGACDGLAMVPPLGDGHYQAYRPTLALEPSGEGAALRLDDTFGLHPSLSAFKPFYEAGQLA